MTRRTLFAPSGQQTDRRRKIGCDQFSFSETAGLRVSSLTIQGKTALSGTPSFSSPPTMLSLGEKSASSVVSLSVHIHGTNRFDGYQFSDLLQARIPSGTYSDSGTKLYFTIPADTDAVIVGPKELRFKALTAYTVRMYFSNSSGHSECPQFAWLYTDGTEDVMITEGVTTVSNKFVSTSNPAKTVYGIKHHFTRAEQFTFFKTRFGIFEGTTAFNDFTDYTGNTYSVPIVIPLRGFESGGVFVADSIETVSGRIRRRIRDALLDRSALQSLGNNIYRIPLTACADIAYRDILSNIFTPVRTAAEVYTGSHRAALSPAGDAVLLSLASGETAETLSALLAASGNHIYYVIKTPTESPVTGISFTVPEEDGGVEILADNDPYQTELLLTT